MCFNCNTIVIQVLEAVGPIIFLSTDTKKLRNEGFLSPFHPRYPDILTNSAHPMVSYLIISLARGELSSDLHILSFISDIIILRGIKIWTIIMILFPLRGPKTWLM